MYKAYQCAICTTKLVLYKTDRWTKVPMWIGSIRYAKCPSCEYNMTIFRDENKAFVAVHYGFENPLTTNGNIS